LADLHYAGANFHDPSPPEQSNMHKETRIIGENLRLPTNFRAKTKQDSSKLKD